ncbi:MAG: MurR/RpiR family transcriptional regulator [Acidimicrobiales bacterium]
MTSSASPSARLLELFEGHRLTPTQRRIAQCLVEHAADAPFLSSSEVAGLARVSQPSVVRFAGALGFAGYPDLRRRLRRLGLGAPQRETQAQIRRNEFQRAVAEEVANLQALVDLLEPADLLAEVGTALMGSRPLVVLGLRASAALARHFAYFAVKVHPDVRVVEEAGSPVVDHLEQARAAGAGWVLCFDVPRWPRETTEAVRTARELGLRVATITDTTLAPVAGFSDVVLPAAVGTRLVFDSHAAPMVLAMVLLQAMCDVEPTRTQERLEAFEKVAAARQYFES